ncbi:aldo/keto reductase [Gluconacetobacter tumulisoli]|uniref:Aldo/keto reductase n=1 Tax=Gluconacetobacter tumulisoli TaxID=1286189 RepID=A0A7W4PLA1_9PROT|nr:aldo/keto reductase [Gluconacetobacter tumulisoli]MBB2200424.1 aldo/keto reductase [Gluconacetobacter tumulisoli]
MTIPDLTLNDGMTVPVLAFGTYRLNGASGADSIRDAITVGYRGLDSAFNYENEGAVGKAVRDSGIARQDLRIASKLPGRHHAFDEAIATVEESLYRAQLDYYDLYYIHWPNPAQNRYVEAWRALIEARKRGMIRSVAVCNFLPEYIQRLIDETGVAPSINQVELSPYFPQDELRAWHAAHGIATQAWSPLGRANKLISDPLLGKIAERLDKSIPQVVLRWHHQVGAIPIPKAASRARQIENMSIFDFSLTDEDMASIATLARPDGRTFDQNPARYEEF